MRNVCSIVVGVWLRLEPSLVIQANVLPHRKRFGLPQCARPSQPFLKKYRIMPSAITAMAPSTTG